jgi:hypothetical protein
MAAVGISVDLSVAALDVEIEHAGGVHDTMVFDLRDGRAGYVIDTIITNQMSRPVRCRDLELRPPWVDSEFEWLPDSREMWGDPHNYQFFEPLRRPALRRLDNCPVHLTCRLRDKRNFGTLRFCGHRHTENLTLTC